MGYHQPRQPKRVPSPGDGDPRHGQYAGYVAGCRCRPCTNAAVDYQRFMEQERKRRAARPKNPDGKGRRAAGPNDHGSAYGYGLGCRCQTCRDANAARAAAWLAEVQQMGIAPDDPRHGTRYVYLTFRCRCQPCVEANREYVRAWELRRARQVG